MPKWARIAEGTVQEIVNFNPAGEGEDAVAFPPEVVWVAVPAEYEDWVSYSWTSDGVTLTADIDALVAEVKERVANIRWQKLNSNIVVDGVTYLSDPTNLGIMADTRALGLIEEAASGVPGSWSTPWKAVSGVVMLDIAGLVAVASFGGNHMKNLYIREETIVQTVIGAAASAIGNAAKTQVIVNTYNALIDTGWPSNTDEPVTP